MSKNGAVKKPYLVGDGPQAQRHDAIAVTKAAPRHDVAIAYLSSDSITQSFHRSFLNALGYDLGHEQRWALDIAVRSGTMALPESRNKAVLQMLDESECQWLWMVDSDMGFDEDTLDRLLAVADPKERPVVGALCFAMRESGTDGMGGMHTFPSPTILLWHRHDDGIWRFTGKDHYPANSMIRVGATGAACLLIHRSALEQVRERFGVPAPRLDVANQPVRDAAGAPRWTTDGQWFTRVPDESGMVMGEDISFCWRLQEVGIPVWIHTGVRTTHYKHVWLNEMDFWNSRIAPPATERVDVVVPSLHRPQNVAPFMRSLRASTGLARAWWVCEPDDIELHEAVRAEGGELITEHASFPAALNIGYRRSGSLPDAAPWLLFVGDDVRFRPGWLDQALDVADRYEADVVATNDLLNPRTMAGTLATHPVIRRRYIDEVGASWDGPGSVCHEGYHHLFVDDEWTMAAQLRGVFQAALGSHVEHLHPYGGKAAMDDVYRLGEQRHEEDALLFQRRVQEYAAPKALVGTR